MEYVENVNIKKSSMSNLSVIEKIAYVILQSEEDTLECIKPDPRIEKIKSLISYDEIKNAKDQLWWDNSQYKVRKANSLLRY